MKSKLPIIQKGKHGGETVIFECDNCKIVCKRGKWIYDKWGKHFCSDQCHGKYKASL